MFIKQIGDSISEVSHKRIESPDPGIYVNHIHDYCEILLFISGDADYNIDGQTFHPSPYDLIFIPSATYHCLLPVSSQPYENYVIGFKSDIIGQEHYKKLFSSPLLISIKEETELCSFFSRLDMYEKYYDEKDFSICAFALIKELAIYCSYRKDTLRSAQSEPLTHIERIVNFISENIEAPIDAHSIARHMHFSESYIQNLFSQNMRIGLKKYIMQKKIYAARCDIQNGMSPSQVGKKYGFGDYSSFYRLYKKTFGISPQET